MDYYLSRHPVDTGAMKGTCENPQYPTWTWRYNRDKHLSMLQPWYTRVDQWNPRYRHMGVPYGFNFTPCAVEGGPREELGVTYAKHLHENREVGSGNAGLGHTPGPAPPRLRLYDCPELRQNLADRSRASCRRAPPHAGDPPLHPQTYLKETLKHDIDYHAQYPHFQLPREPLAPMAGEPRQPINNAAPICPLSLWRDHFNRLQQKNIEPQAPPVHTAPVCQRPTSSVLRHHKMDGDSRKPYPLANF